MGQFAYVLINSLSKGFEFAHWLIQSFDLYTPKAYFISMIL